MVTVNVESVPEPARRNEIRARPSSVPPESVADLISQATSALDARVANLDRQLSVLRHLLATPLGSFGRVWETPIEKRIAVTCLGPFGFVVDGVPFENWRSGRARSLFQYLVTHRGQAIPRDTLISALWPDASVSAPATSLKVAVHALRQTLGNLVESPSSVRIVSQGSCYQLTAPDLCLDVEDFERCYASGLASEAEGNVTEAVAAYTRAARLYRGDFLEDILDDWPAFRREALKDQYLFVVARLAGAAVDMEDYHGAIVWCQQLLAKDRCREDTYRTLMICHARLGQRSRVRSWYELCVRTLRYELDCEPEPETERIARLALAGKL